jgi:hypothetical protein
MPSPTWRRACWRARDQLLPADLLEDPLLGANVVDRLRVAPGQLADLATHTLARFRQRVIDRLLASAELDQQVAGQVDSLLYCRRPLQALDG